MDKILKVTGPYSKPLMDRAVKSCQERVHKDENSKFCDGKEKDVGELVQLMFSATEMSEKDGVEYPKFKPIDISLHRKRDPHTGVFF